MCCARPLTATIHEPLALFRNRFPDRSGGLKCWSLANWVATVVHPVPQDIRFCTTVEGRSARIHRTERADVLFFRLLDRTGPFTMRQRDFLKSSIRPLKLSGAIDEHDKRLGFARFSSEPVPSRPTRCFDRPTIGRHPFSPHAAGPRHSVTSLFLIQSDQPISTLSRHAPTSNRRDPAVDPPSTRNLSQRPPYCCARCRENDSSPAGAPGGILAIGTENRVAGTKAARRASRRIAYGG